MLTFQWFRNLNCILWRFYKICYDSIHFLRCCCCFLFANCHRCAQNVKTCATPTKPTAFSNKLKKLKLFLLCIVQTANQIQYSTECSAVIRSRRRKRRKKDSNCEMKVAVERLQRRKKRQRFIYVYDLFVFSSMGFGINIYLESIERL